MPIDLIAPGTQLIYGSLPIKLATLGAGLTYDTVAKIISATSNTGDVTWSVLEIRNNPPGGASTGDIYLVGTSPTGAWIGHANEIATWGGASWSFQTAAVGDLLQDNSTSIVYQWTGTVWAQTGKAPLLAGGNAGIGNLRGGTSDNKPFSIITNGAKRLEFSNAGAITFTDKTGAAAGLMGLSTAGVASNVQLTANDFNLVADVLSIDYANGQKASSSVPGFATVNQTIREPGCFASGNGTVVPVGVIGEITFFYSCTIVNWAVSADASGTIQFDIKRSGSSIIGGGGNKPALSSQQNNTAAVSGWTSTAITAGDVIQFLVDSAVTPLTVTRASCVLKVFPS